MSEEEAIRASDLMKLMEVVKAATGLYNALEREEPAGFKPWRGEYDQLGEALRGLGLTEVS